MWRKERDGGEICLIQLTSLKRKIVPRGLYKRGTIVCTTPGSLQWWQGCCSLVNALWPESFFPPLHFGGVPWTRGLWHIVGYHIHLGRWSRFGMRLRNVVFTRVPNDSTFPVADLQLSGKYWRSGFTSNGSFSFFFNTPPPRVFFFVEVVVVVIYPVVFLTPKLYNHVHIFSRMFLYFRSWTPCVIWNLLIWHEGSYNFFQWIFNGSKNKLLNNAIFMLCSEVPPLSYIKFTCAICFWHLLFLWPFSVFLNQLPIPDYVITLVLEYVFMFVWARPP